LDAQPAHPRAHQVGRLEDLLFLLGRASFAAFDAQLPSTAAQGVGEEKC
jgi:hypothetical protein